ncbi:TAFII55 protein conserved region-domain-containing protein [Phaeosphaeria sp. MPI-PUGE-AT-0046c]|nr:TAFII55 protein conserved region-domain-containing protein [Phaeosphaeria sp. MPI-PUGE-AT-0046c]
MKIKLKNPNAPASDAPTAAAQDGPAIPAPPKAGKLKLNIKAAVPSTAGSVDAQDGAPPKAKRKYTKKAKVDEDGNPIPLGKPGPKKRAREDGDDIDPPAAKRKSKPTAKSLAMDNDTDDDDDLMVQEAPRAPPVRTHSIKLSIKPKGNAHGAPPRTGTATMLKVKGGGKPPPRPYGVGYDSEADEAEPDPAQESQFILRMQPGPDCDLLRKSIEEKTIGKSMAHGGPGVQFRFFDREGRRAMVTIQGRNYAASMVELPTVIETMKSWNKKDWVKTADVCQMLLVLGKVSNEEEAKKYPRPSYVEPDSHRYPHGITPPMQWARKLRFRPRKSYLDVERAEAEMNRLLVEDDNAESSKYELVDSDQETSEEESGSEEEVDEDEEMMNAQQVAETPMEEVDVGDLEQLLHEGLMEDDDIEIQADDQTVKALLGGETPGAEPATPATAHDVALHALNQHGTITLETETAASTPAAATSADDEDDDDDDDDDSDDDEVDDAAVQEEQRKEQLRAEIAELDRAIQTTVEARDRQTNQIFKKRMQTNIDKQKADREIKRKLLDEDADE